MLTIGIVRPAGARRCAERGSPAAPCRERPRRRAAESNDEIAPSKANAHLAVLCETVHQTGGRGSTGNRAPVVTEVARRKPRRGPGESVGAF
jgi:hypothetical protein